ncbi:cytochrome P450 [Multifurca ochricompacta]|uniref:Cytochrome P450 n=1 Tax=Multifurca ochricompacta TaxID=376703 RepID=A0AAD4M2Q4_9AGAM|nr:cytochrome P450 [Multifurca ochricompacta]
MPTLCVVHSFFLYKPFNLYTTDAPLTYIDGQHMSFTLSATDVFTLIVVSVTLYWVSKRTRLPLPPGPKGWPLIGNLLDIPKANFGMTYSEWAMKYGKIIYADAAGQPLIIINDVDFANEMLDKTMAGELAGFREWTSSLNYGPQLKESRKYMRRAIGTRESLKKFNNLFESENQRFLKATLRDPDNVHEHICNFTGAVISRIIYGYEAQDEGDPIIALAQITLKNFSRFTESGAYLVDFIPALKYIPAWFPGAGFKNEASAAKKSLQEMAEIPFQHSMQEMAEGTAPSSFITDNMKNITTEIAKRDLKWSASSLFAEVQRKAQAEIDRVIGNDRLPCLADRDNLHYVSALQDEIYRWRPITPVGVPHKTTAADTCGGYYIPKGSIILPNIWHMLHDPAVYSNPDSFSPERFLATDDKHPEQDPRACLLFGLATDLHIGSLFADATVWLTIATALAVFRISKVVEGGVEVTPDGKYISAFISHPEKFRCDIKPRSAWAEALILQS